MKKHSPSLTILFTLACMIGGACLVWFGLAAPALYRVIVITILLAPALALELVSLIVFDALLPPAMAALGRHFKQKASGSLTAAVGLMVGMILFLAAWIGLLAFLVQQ